MRGSDRGLREKWWRLSFLWRANCRMSEQCAATVRTRQLMSTGSLSQSTTMDDLLAQWRTRSSRHRALHGGVSPTTGRKTCWRRSPNFHKWGAEMKLKSRSMNIKHVIVRKVKGNVYFICSLRQLRACLLGYSSATKTYQRLCCYYISNCRYPAMQVSRSMKTNRTTDLT